MIIKLILGLFSGFLLIKKIEGATYFLIAQDLALILGWGFLIVLLLSLAVGFLGGWFWTRKKQLSLLLIKKERVMIISPHPDDEVLAAGGLLAYLFQKRLPTKIVYLTCGDANPSLFWRDKKIRYSPAKFIQTGKERKQEAEKAIKILGGNSKNLVFLGYPDGCLLSMWLKPKKLVVSPTTKLNHSGYNFTFKKHRQYQGLNLMEDLYHLIQQFKPTILLLPHSHSSHPDHRAASFFGQKVAKKTGLSLKIYYYLIHYKWLGLFQIYPSQRKQKHQENILYPPFPLWQNKKWFSFWLHSEQLRRKKLALQKYKSQQVIPPLKLLFQAFLAQNEIFQIIS